MAERRNKTTANLALHNRYRPRVIFFARVSLYYKLPDSFKDSLELAST